MENSIGKRIKEIREQKKLSTYDLAKMTGISQSTISKLENGKRSVDLALLRSISKALNVDVSDFLVESNNLLIGVRIKKQRELKGLSVDELSEKSGIGIKLLLDIEDNNLKPGLETIEKIAETLSIPTSYLAATNYNDFANASLKTLKLANEIKESMPAEGYKTESTLVDNMDSEDDVITKAAHKVGHEGPLTDEEKERIELAIRIALAKHNK